MGKEMLTISPKYMEQEWGLWEAVRELVSNAYDAQMLGKSTMGIKYILAKETLMISSVGATVPFKALFMGEGDGFENMEAIGQFGEGLPMTMLVLARLVRSGVLKSVKIYNGTESWKPVIDWSKRAETEALFIVTRKLRAPRPGFFAEIEGISLDTWEQFQKLLLFVDKGYTDDMAVAAVQNGVVKGYILTDPAYKGLIFRKGVFVQRRTDLLYGYNLIEANIGRDRHLVDEWDLKMELKRMTAAVVKSHPDRFKGRIMQVLETGESCAELDDAWVYKAYEPDFVDSVVKQFEEKHGENAVPVSNISESRELAHLGKKGVVVSKTFKDLVESRKGSLESVKEKAASKSTKTYSWTDLEPREQQILEEVAEIVNLASAIRAGVTVLDHIQVVDFADPDQIGRFDTSGNVIRLAKKVLVDWRETMKTLVHELAHADAILDGSLEHHEAMESIYVDCVVCLAERGAK